MVRSSTELRRWCSGQSHTWRNIVSGCDCVRKQASERSRKAYALILVSVNKCVTSQIQQNLLERIAFALAALTRDTDVTGWYESKAVVGVIFTDIVMEQKHSVIEPILSRVSGTLHDSLTMEQINQISISIHCYPEDWQHEVFHRPSDPALYPDLALLDDSRKISIMVKRIIDIVGSALALILLAPLFW